MYFDDFNPVDWPTEMAITVASGEQGLIELLWIRHHTNGYNTSRLPHADLPNVGTITEWSVIEADWTERWSKALGRSAAIHLLEREEIPNRPDLWGTDHPVDLAEAVGVSLDGAGQWRRNINFAHGAERKAIPELRAAWSNGLRLIIELPLVGDYGIKYSKEVLIVSSNLRADLRKYAAFLSSF